MSRAIRLYTRIVATLYDLPYFDCSHAEPVLRMSFQGERDHVLVAEATAKHGLRLVKLSQKCTEAHGQAYLLKAELSCDQRARALPWLHEKGTLGLKYDRKSLIKYLTGKVSMDLKQVFCSEIVLSAWLYIGYQIPLPGNAAPKPGDLPSIIGVKPVRIDI